MITAEQRQSVRQAAAYLDEEFPGWHRKMKPEHLQMGSCTQCALGQLFGAKAELSIAKKLYPKEWAKVVEKGGVKNGFSIGMTMIFKRLFKKDFRSLTSSSDWMAWMQEDVKADFETRRLAQSFMSACSGDQDLQCGWAEEVADRLAKDEMEEEAAS